MTIFNPTSVPSYAKITIAETEVFNGTSATTFTDLDLSAVVGANLALVVLKVKLVTGQTPTFFRKNGDTEPTGGATDYGVNSARGPNVTYAYTICPTDAYGIVEWLTTAAVTTTIDMVAYIK